jgi:hypothetical protein
MRTMSHLSLYRIIEEGLHHTLCMSEGIVTARGIEPGICLLKVLSKALVRLKVLSQYLGIEVSSRRSVSSRTRAKSKRVSSLARQEVQQVVSGVASTGVQLQVWQ